MKKYRMRRMTTAQLDKLLHAELRKDTPDEDVVLPILEILENREQKSPRKHSWIVSAAAVATVLVLLIAVAPKAVGANSIWDAILHLSESVMQFFAPGVDPRTAESEYIFQTENPGLQQLYNEVAKRGITDPVVPMWLPDGYDLKELKTATYDDSEKLTAVYMLDNDEIVIEFRFFDHEIPVAQYETLQGEAETYESGRISYAIARNNEKWAVVWVRPSVECLITTGGRKENVIRIIDSIYGRF